MGVHRTSCGGDSVVGPVDLRCAGDAGAVFFRQDSAIVMNRTPQARIVTLAGTVEGKATSLLEFRTDTLRRGVLLGKVAGPGPFKVDLFLAPGQPTAAARFILWHQDATGLKNTTLAIR